MSYYRSIVTGLIFFCTFITVIGTAVSVQEGGVYDRGEENIETGTIRVQADTLVDASSPGYAAVVNPVHVGSMSNGGDVKLSGPRAVFVAGNYAYVASGGSNALEIVNISNPAAPVHAGSISNGGEVKLNNPMSVFVAGNYAYVASGGSNALEIVNVSNPAAPIHAGSISNGGYVNLIAPRSVFVAGNYAYVASYQSNTLEIVDVSNPAAPIHAGRIINGGDAKLNYPTSVFVAGNYAYVTSQNSNALEIVDVSNPAVPVHAGSISNGGDVKLNFPSSVFISGNYAYVASMDSAALEIIDVSNPAAPVHAGSISYGGDVNLVCPFSVFVAGNYAYVLNNWMDTLEIVDVSNPAAPVHAGNISNGGDVKLDYPLGIFVAGNYVYVAGFHSNALEIMQYTNPNYPIISSITPKTAPNTRDANQVTLTGFNFQSGSQVNLTNGTLSIPGTVSSLNSTIIRCSFPLTGAPTRTYIVNMLTPGGTTGSLSGTFTVTNETPTITTITPAAAGFNSGTVPVTISGTAFRNGVSVTLVNGSTVIPGTITSRTTTLISCTFPLNTASPGLYNLIVRNIDGLSVTNPDAFTIKQTEAYPTITGFYPHSGINTGMIFFSVTGDNFRTGATVTITNGTANKTVSGTVISPIVIQCTLPLSGLPFGLYNLTIRNTDGSFVNVPDAFTVNNPAPAITTLTPASGYNTSSITVAIAGSKFISGCQASLVNGSTVIPGTVTSYTGTKITGTFPLAGAVPGTYNLTVTNPAGPNATKPFTVLNPGTDPTIASLSPGSGVNTAALPFTVIGTNFRTGATVTITNGSTSKTIAGTLTGTTTIKCSLPLTGLPIGLYNLMVRNTDGSNITRLDAFSVSNPIPIITTLTPASGYNTSTLPVAVAGSKFVSGCQVSLVNGSTVIPGIITSFISTKITGTFALAGVAPGIYNLTVTNPGGPNATKQFTILSPAIDPAIMNFTPVSGQNTAALPITINGANFRTGVTVTITNGTTNKTVAGTLTGTTVIKCTLPLTGLPIGLYNVTIRNTDGSNVTRPDAFTVNNPTPTITTLTPASGYNTGFVPVAIAGSKFVAGCQVTLVNGSTVIPGIISGFTTSKFTAGFNLAGTTSGNYNLTVTNPGGPNATKSFTVRSPDNEPTITSLTPTSGVNTAALSITITGTNYRAGATVTITNRTTTKTVAGALTGNTTIKCSLPLTGLPIGLYNLTVRNPDGSNITRTDAFIVLNPSPAVTSITPVSGYNSGTITVTITGTKFVSGAAILLINGSTTIPGTVASLSATKISGIFPLAEVSPGKYNLTVSNPGDVNGTKPNAFTVIAHGTAPVISNISPVSAFNTANLPVTIAGLNFNKPTVYLSQGSLLKLAAATAGKTSSATTLYVTFPLKGISGGLYNITVRNSDGVNTTAQEIFYVTDQAWISSTNKTPARSSVVRQVGIPRTYIPTTTRVIPAPSDREVISRAVIIPEGQR